MIQIQCTLFSDTGKYKPMSTIVKVNSLEEYEKNASSIQWEAIKKICVKRYVDIKWLKKYGYTKLKWRVYDKDKIEQENKERYNKIKTQRGWA